MIEPNARVNDGARPSHLALDRYATGELTDDERAALEPRLTDAGRAHLAAVERSRSEVAPFDADALRRRARSVVDQAPPTAGANNTRLFAGAFGLLAVAAVALIAVTGLGPDDPARPEVRLRTGDAIELYEQRGDQLQPWGGAPLGAEDVVGFKVGATGHSGVVVLSVDGAGVVSVFWPAAGDAPERITGDGLVPLPGTLTLDGAPGPELFVAVFDRAVPQAKAELERVYREGGPGAVVSWA
ncbi:MAG: hypothetical protein ABMA64_38930, partial [Myxococcota bacterium]